LYQEKEISEANEFNHQEGEIDQLVDTKYFGNSNMRRVKMKQVKEKE
jgi:hypothetical protein